MSAYDGSGPELIRWIRHFAPQRSACCAGRFRAGRCRTRFLSPEQTFPHLSEGGYRDEPGSPSPPSHAMTGGLQVRWTRAKAHPRPLCGNGDSCGSPCQSPQQTEWPPWYAAKIAQSGSAASQIGLLCASSMCSFVKTPFSRRTQIGPIPGMYV